MTYVPEQKPEEPERAQQAKEADEAKRREAAERAGQTGGRDRDHEHGTATAPRTGDEGPGRHAAGEPGVVPARPGQAKGPGGPLSDEPGTAPAGVGRSGGLGKDAPVTGERAAGERPTGQRPAGEKAADRKSGGGITNGTDPLMPVSERDKLHDRLQQAVNGFVDGPRHAVEEADRVFEETVTRVTDSLSERHGSIRTAWKGQDHEAETEDMRVALRTYREVTERLLEL